MAGRRIYLDEEGRFQTTIASVRRALDAMREAGADEDTVLVEYYDANYLRDRLFYRPEVSYAKMPLPELVQLAQQGDRAAYEQIIALAAKASEDVG